MECLNVRGSCVVSSRSGCQTVNVRPCADQEMMWSLLGSLTRFHVFLRGVDGRRQRTAWVDGGTGGVISAGRGKFPRASARRGTFSRARLRARQVTAQDGRIDRGSGRHAGARRDASRRAGTSGRYREDIGRWPAPRASRDGTPPRSTCQNKKKLGTSGGGGGTARRTIGTVTRSRWRTGSWRPSRCPAARSRPWPRSCPRE